MPTAVDRLLELLDLEAIELNLFRGKSPDEERQRVFGGQVLAQALVAARRTVDEAERQAHSFHAYFLRPGDPRVPILYQVDRIRDGRSFTTRRVVAIQHGRAIFNLAASFQQPETGLEYQAPMPEAPPPESLPTPAEYAARLRADAPPEHRIWLEREDAVEHRYADPINWYRPEVKEPRQRIWIRATQRLPDDPALHQAVFAYASDMSLLDNSALPHGVSYFDDAMQIASLDHSIWFHRPFRADEWLLYASDCPSTSSARGFNRGSVFTREGAMVASVTQEGLIRKR